MDISVTKLLDKIGEELTEAKRAGSEAKIRERAQAIKVICELILEESSSVKTAQTVAAPTTVGAQPVAALTLPMIPQQGILKIDDGANGDSLFDF